MVESPFTLLTVAGQHSETHLRVEKIEPDDRAEAVTWFKKGWPHLSLPSLFVVATRGLAISPSPVSLFFERRVKLLEPAEKMMVVLLDRRLAFKEKADDKRAVNTFMTDYLTHFHIGAVQNTPVTLVDSVPFAAVYLTHSPLKIEFSDVTD